MCCTRIPLISLCLGLLQWASPLPKSLCQPVFLGVPSIQIMDAKFSQLPNIPHPAAAPAWGEPVGFSTAQPCKEQAARFPFWQVPPSLLETLLEPSHPLNMLRKPVGTCTRNVPSPSITLPFLGGWVEGRAVVSQWDWSCDLLLSSRGQCLYVRGHGFLRRVPLSWITALS